MDEIFGLNNFRGDITRIKCNPKNFKRKTYGNIKDLILFYTKTNNYVWNEPRVPLSKDDIERLYAKKDDKGQRYTTVPLHAPGETKNGATGKK
jgi:adenine-specific DNA-methyltransferase